MACVPPTLTLAPRHEPVFASSGIGWASRQWSPDRPAFARISPYDIFQARILIVDDIEDNVVLLKQTLVHAGYARVETTLDPCAVCDLHNEHHYDLILLDLDMPRMNGFEVMASLKGMDGDGFVPVVVLTANPNERRRALEAGAMDFFSKPFDVAELLTRITNTLAARMLHHGMRQRNRGLERDLAVAVEICDALLPTRLPGCPGYEVVALSRSAEETSGDVYDVVRRPNGNLVLLVADATGHGLGPAISATQLRSMLRMALRLDAPLARIVAEANLLLTADLPADRYVTAFLGEFDPISHTLHYLAPGQGPILHWHAASRTAEWRNASSPPFGVATGPFDAPAPMQLEVGDIVMVATDGIFERMDAAGRMFGETGVEAVLEEAGDGDAETLGTVLQSRADLFGGRLAATDDATIVILKRTT